MYGESEARHFAEFNSAGQRKPAVIVAEIPTPISQQDLELMSSLVNVEEVTLATIRSTYEIVKTFVISCLQR